MITLKSVHRLFLKLPSRDVVLEQLSFSSCSDTCIGRLTRSSSAYDNPVGSGNLKYIHTRHKRLNPAQKKLISISTLLDEYEDSRSLAFPVPSGRIEHIRCNCTLDDADDTIQSSSQIEGLDQESTR